MLREQIALHARATASKPILNPITPSLARNLATLPTASPAAKSLRSGLSRVQDLKKSLSQDAVPPASSTQKSPTPSTSESSHEMTPDQNTALEQHVLEQHRTAVDKELRLYFESGTVISDSELENFDLLHYWQVSRIH
jgi:hypothetical protein